VGQKADAPERPLVFSKRGDEARVKQSTVASRHQKMRMNVEVEMEERIGPVWAYPRLRERPRRKMSGEFAAEPSDAHSESKSARSSATHARAKTGSNRGDSGEALICISPMEKESGDGPAVPLRAEGLLADRNPAGCSRPKCGQGFRRETRFSLGSIVLESYTNRKGLAGALAIYRTRCDSSILWAPRTNGA
jgi:hypothetical protein